MRRFGQETFCDGTRRKVDFQAPVVELAIDTE
jgi:hypothetical protein